MVRHGGPVNDREDEDELNAWLKAFQSVGTSDIPVKESESFDETKHPRANDGKFGSGGGSASTGEDIDTKKPDTPSDGSTGEKKALSLDTVKPGDELTSENIHNIVISDNRDPILVLTDIVKKVLTGSESVHKHGMVVPTKMKSMQFNGMTVSIDTGLANKEKVVAQTLHNIIYGNGIDKALPSKLFTFNKHLVITRQTNEQDTHWESQYGISGFKSAATGGDGDIVVYNARTEKPMDRRIFAHEAGHNLANQLWASTTPAPDSEYAQAAKEEPPVSDYGKCSPAEDFAEAVMFYSLNGSFMEKEFPKKYAVIHKLMSTNE